MATKAKLVAVLVLLPGCNLFLLDHNYRIEGDATATDGQQSWGVSVLAGSSSGETELDELNSLRLGLSPKVSWEEERVLPYLAVVLDFSEPVGELGSHAVTVVGGELCSDRRDRGTCVDLRQAGWSGGGTFTTLDYRRLDNPDPSASDPEHPRIPEQEGSATVELELSGPGGKRYTISGGSLTLSGAKHYPSLG